MPKTYLTQAKQSAIDHVVNLLSNDPNPANCADLNDDDWDNIAVTAIVLGLAPLLHWHLEQHQITIPPMALAKLAVTRQAHAKRNQAIANQLAEILTQCKTHDIPAIALKGVVLASHVYPDPALRPMNDIDLLFQPNDLPKVGQLLEALGYCGKTKDASQGAGVTKHLSTYQRNGDSAATPNPYLSADSDRMVEPHLSLEESWFGLKVDITPGVWQRAVPMTCREQPYYRLSTSDMLLHLTVHATFHVIMGASVFVQLYDIGRVIDAWAEEIDWSEILALAYAGDAQPFVYAALYWANQLYGASVPDMPLQALACACPPALTAYIHTFDAAALFNRTQQPPLINIRQRLKRGFVDRRETARWAGSLSQKLKVWETALAFYKTDTANLLAGRSLKTDV